MVIPAWKEPVDAWPWEADMPNTQNLNTHEPPWRRKWNKVFLDPNITETFDGVQWANPRSVTVDYDLEITRSEHSSSEIGQLALSLYDPQGNREIIRDRVTITPGMLYHFDIHVERENIVRVQYHWSQINPFDYDVKGHTTGLSIGL